MKAVGIIAEYNPLHYGHIYHIEESRKLAGADAVVVAMSGNYVQHGEPAILDKWERAKHAVNHGADVVVEIPALFCLGNSSQYAEAGIRILESMGFVDKLSFGSECGNIEELKIVAERLSNFKLNNLISEISVNYGYSYPRAREIAYHNLYGDEFESTLKGSNNNLAISYLMSVSKLEPFTVMRKGSDYTDEINESSVFQSASGIRKAIYEGINVEKYVPSDVLDSLDHCHVSDNDLWFSFLKYAVLSKSSDEIDACPSGGDGLGNKIKKEIYDAKDWNSFILSVKSKRYTYSRISRLCMQIVLGLSADDLNTFKPGYIRILALSQRGRKIIKESEKDNINTLPYITNIAKQVNSLNNDSIQLMNLDIKVNDIYNLIVHRNVIEHSDYRKSPYIQE